MVKIFIIAILSACTACASTPTKNKATQTIQSNIQDTVSISINIADTSLIDIETISNEFVLDFKYADTANFFKKKIYPCQQCKLRYEVAKALIAANDSLLKLGFQIKLFDCYRPFSVQQFMWTVLPDSRYVANPQKGGSIHNRGGAVDLTIEHNHQELDMGTEYDHFGKESAHSYSQLNDTIIHNRLFLKEIMEQFGFVALQTEWWHYSFKNAKRYSVSNENLECK